MTRNSGGNAWLLAGISLVSLTASKAALAQASAADVNPPTATQAVADPSSGGANDIVVTAQRRSERLVDVPASIVTQTGEALRTAGVTRFQDLGLVTPSVQIANSGSYNQPTIRGISTTFAAGGQEINTAIYVDGFYTSDQLSINQDLVNIADIQVLKGPQGTLYGRNATGGAILINTLVPGDKFEARASLAYAPRYDEKAFSAYLAAPLAKGVSFGVAASYRDNDGYIKDVNKFAPDLPIRFADVARRGSSNAAPYKNYSIRPKLVLDPVDDIRIILGYTHALSSDPRSLATTFFANRVNSAPSYDGYETTTERDRTSLNFQPVVRIKTDETNLTAQFGLGDFGTLTGRSAYRWQQNFQMYDLDGSVLDGLTNPTGTSYDAILRERRRTFTQQLDLVAKPAPGVDLLAGLFYYRDKYLQHGTEDLGLSFSPTNDLLVFRTESWAAYVDGTIELANKLYFTAGGRYSEDRKNYEATRVDNMGVVIPSQSVIGYYPEGVAKVNDHAFTPRANLRYNLTPGSNVYVSWSKGFKSATINSYAPYNQLKPEKATAYEAGYKMTSGRLRGEVAAFYYDFKDNQVSAINASSGSIQTLIENSGGARVYGLDGLLNFQVDSHLSVRTSAAYLHARYTNFDNATNVIVDPLSGLNTSTVGSWTGRRLARAPDWTATVGADYEFDVGGGKAVLNATGHYSSRYAPLDSSYECAAISTPTGPVCPVGTDTKHAKGRFEENGYFLVNAQASWTEPSDHWTFTLYTNNLTSTRYKVFSQGFFYATLDGYNEPRTIGGRISLRY